MTLRLGVRFIQRCVVGIELRDGFDSARGITFAEHPRKVRLHQAVVINWRLRLCSGHRLLLIFCSSLKRMFHAPSSKHRWNSIERLVEKRFPWSDLIVFEKKGPGIADLQ